MLDILARWNRWGTATLEGGFTREITQQLPAFLDSPEALVFIGPRRAGKTTVLFQIMDMLEKNGIDPKAMLHLNLEEPALTNQLNIELLEDIYHTFRTEIFPEGKAYIFLDEIQNVPQWERWVRVRNETENIKIFITGSSSKLLSRELGTLLTGRHISFKVLPLSFKEYLYFKSLPLPANQIDLMTPPAVIQQALQDYLKWGGFPEVALATNDLRKELLLKQYFDDVLFKDVALRHRIRDTVTLRNLAVHLLTHTGNLISFQRIAKIFGVSLDLAKAYCLYLQEAFLIELVPFFSRKAAERNRNPQKIHALDLGLRQVLSLATSADSGHISETAVYQHIARQAQDGVFYWKQQHEIDLLIRHGNTVKALIQICHANLKQNTLPDREMAALKEASQHFIHAKKTLILSAPATPASFKKTDKDTALVPLWRFLLSTY